MYRSQMSPKERSIRSRITKLVNSKSLLRASVTIRKVTCGKPNCRCAKGDKHLAVYITSRKDGKSKQLFIPKKKEEEVRRMVEDYHKVLELINELSELYWEKLIMRKK